MPVVSDTAYPRLSTNPTPAELEAFTPGAAELASARQRTRQHGPRLAFLVLLKAFQRLGRFVRRLRHLLADLPASVTAHVAARAELENSTAELAGDDDSSYRVRLTALVRGHLGVSADSRAAHAIADAWEALQPCTL